MPFAAPLARALLRSQSDARLVALARDHHEPAFDEIVRRYRTPLVAFAAAYAPGDRAEDVVQESLANAWKALRTSDQEITLKPWLYTIVRNRALNARRDARFHEPLDETIDGVRQPGDIVLERDQLHRVVAAVIALPEPQRRALVDSALEGRTHDQIAATLGTTTGSVRAMIYRGRIAVRSAAGAMVPLPIVSALAESAGGAAAGGVTAGTVAGGSLLAKGATVGAIAILATGSGLVVERSLDSSAKTDREANAEPLARPAGKSDARHHREDPRREATAQDPGRAGAERVHGPGGSHGYGSNHEGPGGPDSGGESGGGTDNSGPGNSGSGESGSGHSGSDDPGSDVSGSDDSGSGSGDSGSGSDNSGSGGGGDPSGSGSGGEADLPDVPDPPDPLDEAQTETKDGHVG